MLPRCVIDGRVGYQAVRAQVICRERSLKLLARMEIKKATSIEHFDVFRPDQQ
jgi:hypothetical protein